MTTRRYDLATLAPQLRTWVEREALTDREIARRLGVSPATAQDYRQTCRIPTAWTFRRTFERTWGPHAEARLRRLVHTGASLRAIGQAFGFTKQYAHLVCRKLGLRTRGMRP